jgi:predicted alpha/beta hydrolase
MHPASPETTKTKIVAEDGFELGATIHVPPWTPRATLVIHGATAVKQSYYDAFAKRAAIRGGLRVITYDYRGIGASRPESLVGFRATMTDWAKLDARALMKHANTFGDPILMVCHSFGGQLVGLIDECADAAGAVMVASQFGWHGHWSGLDRWRMAAVWYVLIPTVTSAFGYLPGETGLGVDLPRGVAAEWAAWCRHPRYLEGAHPDARWRYREFEPPTLLFSFTDDDFAPETSVLALRNKLKRAPLVHRRIDPRELREKRLGHFGFFRKERADDLWEEAFRFFDGVLAGERKGTKLDPPLTEREIMADLLYGRT